MKGHSVCVRSIMKKDLTEIVFILDRSGSFSCRNVSVGRKRGILNSTNRNLLLLRHTSHFRNQESVNKLGYAYKVYRIYIAF